MRCYEMDKVILFDEITFENRDILSEIIKHLDPCFSVLLMI